MCPGYEVADYIETAEFLAISWSAYFDGKLTIEDILKAYKDNGFDANQDFPGNVRWEELYNASPKGTKVILTVRDNDEVWHRIALLSIFKTIKAYSDEKFLMSFTLLSVFYLQTLKFKG